MIVILSVVVGLMIFFWGSRVGPNGTHIMLFGIFSVYDSNPRLMSRGELKRFICEEVQRLLPPPKEDTEDEDEEDSEENPHGPNLWERFTAAGFVTIDDRHGLRLRDIAKIDWEKRSEECSRCSGKLIDLWEVYEIPPSNPSVPVARAAAHPLGHVCEDCGHWQPPQEAPTETHGIIAPTAEPGANFFDVLDHFASLRKPPAEPEVEAASPSPVESTPEPGTQTI